MVVPLYVLVVVVGGWLLELLLFGGLANSECFVGALNQSENDDMYAWMTEWMKSLLI